METKQIMILFGALISILTIGMLSLLWIAKNLTKRINLILKAGGSVNFENGMKTHEAQLKEIQQTLQVFSQEIERLNRMAMPSIQKVGIVRFNPFGNVGGDHSFSIALLDSKNNGVVLTGLFLREGMRTYAKPIVDGTSEYQLSDEEKQAISRAVGASDLKS